MTQTARGAPLPYAVTPPSGLSAPQVHPKDSAWDSNLTIQGRQTCNRVRVVCLPEHAFFY